MRRATAAAAAALAALGAGCGHIADPSCGACVADGAPGGGSDGAGQDAARDPDQFEKPSLIENLADSSASDDDPTVTGDLLELYFNSGRSGDSDIWRSTRDSADQPWDPPVPVDELNSPNSETAPEVSPDGLTIYFSSNRAGTGTLGGQDIWRATRDARDQVWTNLAPVAALNSTKGDYSPVLDGAGTTVVFFSNRSGNQEIYMATRDTPGATWSEPVALDQVNTVYSEADPFLTADGLTLYLSSDRDSPDDQDIYVATRASLAEPFGRPVDVHELDSTFRDADPWLSPDGTYLVMSSGRSGDNEIYEARR